MPDQPRKRPKAAAKAICGVGLGLLLLAVAAEAELADWDQARVTGIAEQLAQACAKWQTSIQGQPDSGVVGSGVANTDLRLVEKAQALWAQSQALAGHLKKGAGRDETTDLYKSLKELVDDTEVRAQESELDEPTMDAWSSVADLMRQIAPYYDPKADTDPSAGSGG
jgi:hypothetical protein